MSGLPRPSLTPVAPRDTRARTPWRLMLIAAAVVVALFVIGTLPRLLRGYRITRAAHEVTTALPVVSVVQPRREVEAGMVLPGNIEGALETVVQARTSGYVEKIYVDIGSVVRKGQVLADISSPDVDQQYAQAHAQTAQAQATIGQAEASLAHSRQQLQAREADVTQAQAQLKLTEETYKRQHTLWGEGFVSRQEVEQAFAARRTARATVASAEAAVRAARADIGSAQKGVTAAQQAAQAAAANERRYGVMRGFSRVRAPFDGVITARNVDVGALINSGSVSGASTGAGSNAPASPSAATSGSGLFGIANADTVKINLQVPEVFAPSIQSGGKARVTVRELPGKTFTGTISLRSGALDPVSRTLQAEIDIPNPDHQLLPGMYARVALNPANPPASLRIPDSALVVDSEGTRVAVVTPDNRVHYQPVRTGRDFGTEIEVRAGLNGDERLMDNPSTTLKEGARVEPHAAAPQESPGMTGAPGGGEGHRRGGQKQ